MAEALGAAVLTVTVDDSRLRAGLDAVQQEAIRTAQIVAQAFNDANSGPQLGWIQAYTSSLQQAQAELGSFATTTQQNTQGLNQTGAAGRSATAAVDALRATAATSDRTIAGMNARLAALQQQLQGVSVGSIEFRRLQGEITRTQERLDQATGSSRQFGQAFASVGNTLRNVAALAGVVGIGALAQQFIATGTASQRADIQLRALAGAYGEVQQATEAVERVQKVTGQSALEAASSFTQLYGALRGTGLTIDQIQVLFVGLNNAARQAQLGAAEATGVFLQLRQGLASGRLQGDELRSVLESLPSLSQAIAKELGVSFSRVKELGSQGKITADVIFGAVRGLAKQAAPGRAAIDDIGIAFKTVQLEAAKALGPALTPLLEKAAAGFVALGTFIRSNRERLEVFAKVTVQFVKALVPFYAGIMLVRGGFVAWAAAVKAAALAQKLLLALSGPKGWAILGAALLGTAASAGLLGNATERISDAMKEAKVDASEAIKEFLKILNITPDPKADANEQQRQLDNLRARIGLSNELAALEIRGINTQAAAARKLIDLQGEALVKEQNRLAIQEKINARRRLELQLFDELSKPKGSGDGKDGTQSEERINDLQNQIAIATAEIRAAYVDASVALVKAAREAAAETRAIIGIYFAARDQARQIDRDVTVARTGLRSPIDSQDPRFDQVDINRGFDPRFGRAVRNAEREGVRRVAAQVFDLQNGVKDAARAAAAANLDLEKARARGKDVPRQELARLVADADIAGRRLEQAGAVAGRSLIDNATEAAKQLRDAQSSFNEVLRGGFQFLNPRLQQQQLDLARREFQPLVNRGIIPEGVPVQTPEQVFGLASFARQFNQAKENVALARSLKTAADDAAKNTNGLIENAKAMGVLSVAIDDLAAKDWIVNVAVTPPTAELPAL